MRTTIDDLLMLRTHDPSGLSRMISWSITVHVIAVIIVALAPKFGWIKTKAPQKIMVINLGGAVGAWVAGSVFSRPRAEPLLQ